ncbi:hypothetical protein ACA910_005408 [Epithemia clementina (nom. ined.)]
MVLLLTTYAAMGHDHDDNPCSHSSGSGKGAVTLMECKISWHIFLQLLQQQDVIKIVMSKECNQARIYLQSNAVGFSSSGSSSTLLPLHLMMSNHPSAASLLYEERRCQ